MTDDADTTLTSSTVSSNPISEKLSRDVTRLIFVKTHKTGGSTLATILHRYARESDAAIFVPPMGYDSHLFNLSFHSDRHVVAQQRKLQLTAHSRSSYEMWTSHAVYDAALHSLVPGDAFLISIVRGPSRRWISAWFFYAVAQRQRLRRDFHSVEADEALELYISTAWNKFRATDFQILSAGDLSGADEPSQWSFNGMLQELAGNAYPSETVADARAFSDRVRQGSWATTGGGRELLLILERFDESLVALARVMGLPGGHAALRYVRPINVGSSSLGKPGAGVGTALSPLAQQRLSDLVVGDRLLYSAANDRLDKISQSVDANEMALFQKSLAETRQACLAATRDLPPKHLDSSSSSNLPPGVVPREDLLVSQLSKEDCEEMQRSDAEWTRLMNIDIQLQSNNSMGDLSTAFKSVVRPRSLSATCALTLTTGTNIVNSRDLAVSSIPFPCAVAQDYRPRAAEEVQDDGVAFGDGTEDHLLLAAPLGDFVGQAVSIRPSYGCSLDAKGDQHDDTTKSQKQTPNLSLGIAVVDRGECAFGAKSVALQTEGFVAVVIVDRAKYETQDVQAQTDRTDEPWWREKGEVPNVPALGIDAARVHVPVVMVPHMAGRLLHVASLSFNAEHTKSSAHEPDARISISIELS